MDLFASHLIVDLRDLISDWGHDLFGRNAFPSHVLVTTSEKDGSCSTISKYRMIVSSRSHVHRLFQLDLQRYILPPLSSQSSLIVAAKGICLALSCDDNSVKTPTSNFIDASLEEGVSDDVIILFLIVILIIFEFLDVSEANRSLRLALKFGMVVLV